VSYRTFVSQLTNEFDGTYWTNKLGEEIAFGQVTRIIDDTGPGEPVRVYVSDLDLMLQERIWDRYDAVNEKLEEMNREEEALSREYGEPMRPAINMDVEPAWATAAILT
jgi:hypothetical protein